ncbi:GNAT family N-acetyltransferase [Agrobacterium tumefaciens]|uniref:GNAT family N-acetyltransferase n=1 Tax=Agrobacterium tumefaciens TaxID=358 RepID=UPI0015716821|nr:GNAT family N-acetyltransferase [Agrobacterium tumefaciens]NSY99645.1 GNAT family N-acetyltransferase [Agrobacterium tumefaciens]NSZ36398.1 GNAT family N-acetyltransferase [Agrobacterium tumefaciens]NTB21914.1 GNAT family N-acetyltransferase [Agrobacterium tumefaciens]NTB31740.1 GNAT family N-acetyltransferase [Agrobacterium tumefaciens]NTB32221.1 GNAT family N-acetyltransferase [Agrobacterium tumefaciens]
MADIKLRPARVGDLPGIVALLSDDMLGKSREDASTPLNPRYLAAFESISTDPNQIQLVAELGEELVGTLQLTLIPSLSRLGTWRGQIEGVRVAAEHRGSGLGQKMFDWAIEESRVRGCTLVQLTTDKSRHDAHRFYERLGFTASHIGYKLNIED